MFLFFSSCICLIRLLPAFLFVFVLVPACMHLPGLPLHQLAIQLSVMLCVKWHFHLESIVSQQC